MAELQNEVLEKPRLNKLVKLAFIPLVLAALDFLLVSVCFSTAKYFIVILSHSCKKFPKVTIEHCTDLPRKIQMQNLHEPHLVYVRLDICLYLNHTVH